ncbi:DUF927 domain-containing protein [Burkholderia gladioli]|uniref:DUF927 domain-containing protein n=1 Tax=Burkholderia gladioli TaxID=28095 RepID=UPI0013F65940|nr:DUF927 domain-containing protein [Burkholderia gladioli]NHH80709.1 DNA primase TraC [Burkholderia gladioli]
MTANDDREILLVALSHIPPDIQHQDWMRVAAGLKYELGEEGFRIFDDWSRGAETYVAATAQSTWKSCGKPSGKPVRRGSIFEIAKRHGFDPGAHRSEPIGSTEQKRLNDERAAQAAQLAAQQERVRRQAAALAARVWNQASPARDDHPYLVRKGLGAVPSIRELHVSELRKAISYQPKANGAPLTGRILIALVGRDADASTLEFIDEEGRKSALSGGAKSGCWWSVAPLPETLTRVLIGEGVATVLSASQATGTPAVAALSCGNLPNVALAIREAHPGAEIVVLADLGRGEADAVRAAEAVGGAVARPDFGADPQEGQTDFDDLRQLLGLEAVRTCIEGASKGAVSALEPTHPAPDVKPTPAPAFPSLEERPCWRVYEEFFEWNGSRVKPGVYFHGVKPGKADAAPELVDRWVCTPLRVIATTRNKEDAEYGRLLELLSPAGRWKRWAMPMALLAGDGSEARAILLGEGLIFDLQDRGAVLRYVANQFPPRVMKAAAVTGWHDGSFVLPDRIIGASDIWFQAAARVAPYATAGTFEGWRELASLASSNNLLMFAVCSAFAGPLLGPLNVDGIGAHLFGDSSAGKTTALHAATSVWGGPSFKRTWRATANGLEGAGSLHSDTFLALDEIGEIDPKSLYEAAYALINGTGKTRANRHGEAKQAARWRVSILSTGETTLAGRMSAGNIEAKAGQGVRILDIPIAGTHGLFDQLHGRVSGGALSDDIRNLAAKHYGHAGPRFVEALVEALNDGFRPADALQKTIERFGAAEGQERRAARTFALCALAGELAARWNITPWSKGEPTAASVHAFGLWRGRRPTNGQSAEHTDILRAVSDFLIKHADSRFSDIRDPEGIARERAGWWRQDGERRLYLFSPSGLREATRGHEIERVLRALEEASAIADHDHGERSKKTHIPGHGKARLYYIDQERLES